MQLGLAETFLAMKWGPGLRVISVFAVYLQHGRTNIHPPDTRRRCSATQTHTQKSVDAPSPSDSPPNTGAHPASHSSSDATTLPSSTTSNGGKKTATINGLADDKAPGAPPKITSKVKAYLTTLLYEDRIWTARQLQEALATQMQVQAYSAT